MGVKQLYNSVHRKFDQLEKKCGRENQHSAEGALRPPIEQLQRRCWNEEHVPERPVEQPRRTGKKRCYGHKSGGQYVAVLFSLQLTSHTVKPFEPFEIKVYFSKELCRSSLLCRRYDSAYICICVCIVVHGYTTDGPECNRVHLDQLNIH